MKNRDVDRLLATYFEQSAPRSEPEGLVERVLEITRETEPRRVWIAHWRATMQTSFRGTTSSFAGPLAAILAVVVLVAGAGLFLLRGEPGDNVGGPVTTPSTSPTLTAAPTLTPRPSLFSGAGLPEAGTRIDTINGAPGIVWAAGHGAIWLSDTGTGSLIRVDDETNEVTRFEIAPPSTVEGDMPVAVDDESVWVVAAPEAGLLQVDPETGAIERDIQIPMPGGAYRMAVSGSSAWISDLDGGTVLHVDLDAGEVASTASIYSASGIAVVDGAPWVATYETGVLQRLNPANGSEQDNVRVGRSHMWVVPDGDRLWLAGNQEARLTRVDTTTGTVTSIDSQRFGSTLSVAVLEGRVFAVVAGTNADLLVEFDAETLEPLAATQAPGWLGAMVSANGSLWVNAQQGLLRFDPAR